MKEFPNYIKLGFDQFGLKPITAPAFTSSSQNDAFSELGEKSVRTSKVREISADKISGGTITAITNIGDDSIVLDGENHEIKIYDDVGNISIYMKGGAA